MCAAAGYGSGGGCTATSNNMATIQGLINLAISETNQAYRNSNIPTRLRLVKAHYDDSYNDYSNDWEVTLSNLRNNNDGQLDYVHAMRDQFGADFVSMIVDTGSYCGIGFRPTTPTAGDAFSLVQWSCATGYYSFGHELAHNMGCNHDRANSEPPYTGDNYGYQDPSNAFRSIMSYDCPTPCPRIQYFSNPDIRYNGRPLGNSGADNASVIRDTLAAHANYRQSVVKGGSNSDPRISTTVPKLTRVPTPSPPSGPPTNTRSIATVFSGGLIGAAGNMFDIRAKANIRITNFAVHATSATAVTVEIWKKKTVGSFVGSESNSNLWEFIGETSFISQASGNPSILPENSFPPVVVKEGDIQAFYITFSGDTNYNRYSPGSAVGKVQVSNRDFDLLEGYAKAYIFGDNYFPRAFNGVIFYELGSSSSSQRPPTPRPTPPPPTRVPTQGSSTRISKRISTPFAGGNGQAGNMMQVQSSQNIVVTTFDIHTYSTSRVHVFVYYKKGSYIGFETDPDAWTLMADAWIDGRGSPNPTRIPEREMTPVSILASETYSFYITLTDSSIRYTNGRIAAGDENLKFIRSAGNKYPFGAYYSDRIWNGNLYYTINSGDSDKKL
jgi:Metallo-peptidase family M12